VHVRAAAYVPRAGWARYHGQPTVVHTSYILFGKARPPLWDRERWSDVVPALDPLVRAAGTDPGVRSTQGTGEGYKGVAFGRLGWDAKSHAKWTHQANDARRFLSVELWVQRWTKTDAGGPELFLVVEEPFVVSKPRDGQFNQILHLAVSDARRTHAREPLARAIAVLDQTMDGVLAVARRAPWLDRGDCVQDLVQNHLRPLGDGLVPDPASFRGRFVSFDPRAPLPEISDDAGESRGDVRAGAPAVPPGRHVYDKAKWHRDGDYPEDLAPDQAFVHAGMFLGWLIDHDLVSDELREQLGEQLEDFKRRKLTGPEVYAACDGCLVDDMLSDAGNAFAKEYFALERSPFLSDYEELLGAELPSLYHVANDWKNYERLKVRIDERFQEWLRGKRWR
jgi:hypothetical protein